MAESKTVNEKGNEITDRGPFAKDFSLRGQIRRAVISIMANIAEGFGRGGSREFLQFLSMAKGSAAEVISHFHRRDGSSAVSTK